MVNTFAPCIWAPGCTSPLSPAVGWCLGDGGCSRRGCRGGPGSRCPGRGPERPPGAVRGADGGAGPCALLPRLPAISGSSPCARRDRPPSSPRDSRWRGRRREPLARGAVPAGGPLVSAALAACSGDPWVLFSFWQGVKSSQRQEKQQMAGKIPTENTTAARGRGCKRMLFPYVCCHCPHVS